jgi:hypothetical protein
LFLLFLSVFPSPDESDFKNGTDGNLAVTIELRERYTCLIGSCLDECCRTCLGVDNRTIGDAGVFLDHDGTFDHGISDRSYIDAYCVSQIILPSPAPLSIRQGRKAEVINSYVFNVCRGLHVIDSSGGFAPIHPYDWADEYKRGLSQCMLGCKSPHCTSIDISEKDY